MNLRMLIPLQIGVIALLAGVYVLYSAITAPDETSGSVRPLGTTLGPLPQRVVSDKGGFAIVLPRGVTAKKDGNAVTLTTPTEGHLINAGPFGFGSVKSNSDAFVILLKRSYTKVRIDDTQDREVDGRTAVATFGRAVNAKKVPIRFVNIVIKAEPRNFAINSFSAAGTTPTTVLPILNAVVNGFTVLE